MKAYEWLEAYVGTHEVCLEPDCSQHFTEHTGLEAGWRSYPKAKCIKWGATFNDGAPDGNYSSGWEIAEWLAHRYTTDREYQRYEGRGRRYWCAWEALKAANV